MEGSNREDTSIAIITKFLDFLRNFRLDHDFLYRDQLKRNLLVKKYYLEVDLGHLINFDESLGSRVREEPGKHLPMVNFFWKTLSFPVFNFSTLTQHDTHFMSKPSLLFSSYFSLKQLSSPLLKRIDFCQI